MIVPGEIDISFLKRFRSLILKHAVKNKFIIICGGGSIARKYQTAAREIAEVDKDELDWVGITATKLNTQLVKSIFGKFACKDIISDPTKKIDAKKIKENVMLASGWKPGWSTDYDSILIAEQTGAETVINLTNVDYVYDKDPRKYRDAKPIRKISWKDFRALVGGEWKPGLNLPFDPIAAKEAEKSKIKVAIINGNNLKNLENIFKEKEFIGTQIV